MRLLICAFLSATALLLTACAPKIVSTIGADTTIPPSQPAVIELEAAPESQATAHRPVPANNAASDGLGMDGNTNNSPDPTDVPGTVLGSHGTIKLNPGTWYVDSSHIFDSNKQQTYYILPLKDNMLYQLNNLEKQGKVTKLKSGIRYAIITPGSGEEATGEVGEELRLKVFNTCADGSPTDERAGIHPDDDINDADMVIGFGGGCLGWEQVVKGMKIGEIRIVEIPKELYNMEPQAARYSEKVYTQMKLLQVGF